MKKIFEKLGFKKADEMERSIQLKSIRLSWIYNVIFLIVWSLGESHKARLLGEQVKFMPSFLLVSQVLILILSQLFWRNYMVKGEDEEKKNPFLKAIAIIALIAVFIVATGILTKFIIG